MGNKRRFYSRKTLLRDFLQGSKSFEDICLILNEMNRLNMDTVRYVYKTLYRKLKESIITKDEFNLIKYNIENKIYFDISQISEERFQKRILDSLESKNNKIRMKSFRPLGRYESSQKCSKTSEENHYVHTNAYRPYQGGTSSGK